jgi:starch synthase (maltosyl-transferring)
MDGTRDGTRPGGDRDRTRPRALEPPEPWGLARPVIEAVTPEVEGGRFPAKREVGDVVAVEADVFTDGHDELTCEVRWRHAGDRRWSSAPMRPVGNDHWEGSFPADRTGAFRFCVRATIDGLGTWLRDTTAKAAAGQDLTVELLVGAQLLDAARPRARGRDRARLAELADRMRLASEGAPSEQRSALDDVRASDTNALIRRYPDPSHAVTTEPIRLVVERTRARFSSWYELFPRSASASPGRHGTFADVEARLQYVARLGFDVLYLPPVHPIGRTNRKGRDGSVTAGPDDPGSPWAIGAAEGGHRSVHPELGTLEDLRRLVEAARDLDIEVALDLAFQCSPDHPWVKEHPEWFRWLPDGTVRCAENPPKRYEDIYPLNFDTPDWRALWDELLAVVRFWIDQGIRIFRVDNPHTKPLRFWEWLIPTVQDEHPEIIFLAEAFTRPKVMYRLAKAGFTQSYTYFAWRNAKRELEQYLQELHGTSVADFFRPNLWPNTPDILTAALQSDGRAIFAIRLLLAATMAASYGIYGPAFELQEHEAREPGSEEYRHSEKYEIRHWRLDDPRSLADLISAVNAIRRQNVALQHDRNLRFHWIDNDQLIAYSRTAPGRLQPTPADAASSEPGEDARSIVVIVNLDPRNPQSGWIELDLQAIGVDGGEPYEMHDLLTDTRYRWQGSRNFVIIDPTSHPAHIFRVEEATARSDNGSVTRGAASAASVPAR